MVGNTALEVSVADVSCVTVSRRKHGDFVSQHDNIRPGDAGWLLRKKKSCRYGERGARNRDVVLVPWCDDSTLTGHTLVDKY